MLAHPLRLRMLSLLTGVAMSAAEVARELGESQANASYHLRRLHEAGLLDVAGEVVIRGGRAKRYRHDPDSGARLLADPAEERQLVVTMAADLPRRVQRWPAGAPGALTDAQVWLDPDSWQRALSLARELGELLHSAAVPPRTPGTEQISAAVALFPVASAEAG
ncbi:Helix-turn-helix domain-containing protein [Saccharopolyspora kobensis]|uniref:Helix-turn-helix domain-containing protein n=1 Tax=Saccharopolyspora kobensis TaxID=146035 RepID=A0A1H5ZEG1_9PSEU|nr:winged helix-turn-helix domain-containing protein [Saccharopolyspora kobensis]SEG34027.1 Helix-turn-helix domain-containing protein [Saccharopolyspora kobensis]SFF17118.1 transcriptional regulator, ArsR family [Saccharopolyspora kobensis]